jgi:hypothetical protein
LYQTLEMSALPNDKNESVNLAALTPEQMADILAKAGGRAIDIEQVVRDIEAGAPVDTNGNLNMLAYTAWLARDAQAKGH